MTHIVLIGAPYSGKGTQSKRLSNKFSLKHISVGDLLRHEIISETQLGLTVESYVKHGDIVPNEVIIQIVRQKINRAEKNTKFIFDGIPRTLPQTDDFEKIIADYKLHGICYIILEVSHTTLIRRAKIRAKLHSRIDDMNSETVLNRISMFEKITRPVIDFYINKGIAHVINGEQTENKVFEDICKVILLS